MPEITFERLDGTRAAAHADELRALHAEVYAEPPYRHDDDGARFAETFGVQRRQPGFVLAEARHGGYLVGYAFGMPLRPSTSWWRRLTTPLPEEVTAEPAGRTFAVAELVVRAPWRRQGIGRDLHDLILAGRPEERATLTVLPAAAAAQQAFRAWGWRKAARTRDPDPGSPTADVLLRPLALSRSGRLGRPPGHRPARQRRQRWRRRRARRSRGAAPSAGRPEPGRGARRGAPGRRGGNGTGFFPAVLTPALTLPRIASASQVGDRRWGVRSTLMLRLAFAHRQPGGEDHG